MKVVVAKVASTLILWLRASLLASPTVVPASVVPCRCTAPVRARIASKRGVLPLWNGPTSAMHRGPLGFAPFVPINTSLAGREVGPLSRPFQVSSQVGTGLARGARADRGATNCID